VEIIGVVGAGTMGAGIAQLALEAGHEVVVHDVDEAALERGRARIADGLGRRAAKLDLDADSIDEWVDGRIGRLREAASLDALGAESDVVIEAAIEDLALKRTIFGTLEAVTATDVILATNTSALPVASIAAATTHPERVLGLHFFNPAPVMRLVEVVVTDSTDRDVAERAIALVESWGRTAVRCQDSPGFIVNRVNRPFTIEALRMLEGGHATVPQVDEAIRAAGFPMGPFELMDLVGVDVNLAAARGVWEGLGRPDRLRPSSIQERLVEAGNLGRKSGEGFYRYGDGRRADDATTDPVDPVDAGAITSRILEAIDAEARLAAAEGVASESDIDLAMRLGAGHPAGPFERSRGG
jgi:3-hydroxybutyryl-CoA dehydrogenase